MTTTTSRARFDAQHVVLHQARPQRLSCELVGPIYIGHRPRRSVWMRLRAAWSRFNASEWRDPILFVLWIGGILLLAHIGGLL